MEEDDDGRDRPGRIQLGRTSAVEYGMYHTFGVKGVVVDHEAISFETELGESYHWPRDEVEAVLFRRPPGSPWRYMTVRFLDGSEPDVYFGGEEWLVERMSELGWQVEIQPRLSIRDLWPFS